MINRRDFLKCALGSLSFLAFPKVSHTVGFIEKNLELGIKKEVLNAYRIRGLNIFWGDIHGHTGFSDGYGLPEEYFYVGRYVNNLDFCAVSDHAQIMNNWQTQLIIDQGEKSLWETTIDMVDKNHEPGQFVTILAFEWTSPVYGHRNVYFRDTANIPNKPLGWKIYRTPDDLWEQLSKYDAFTVPHHLIRLEELIDTDFQNNDFDRLVEIHSKWGASEHPYADYETMREYVFNPELIKFAEGHSALDMLNKGFKVGIIGGTDTHQGLPGSCVRDERRGTLYDPRTDPTPETVGDFLKLLEAGYTWDFREPTLGGNGAILAVFSEDLTRERIWDSLYDRHTYASTGARALLYFLIKDTADSANQAIMGDEIYIHGNPEILTYVSGEPGSIIEKIELIKDREPIFVGRFDSKDVVLRFEDESYDGTPSFYLVKVFLKQSESHNNDNDNLYDKWEKAILGPQLEERLWGSPIWVYST